MSDLVDVVNFNADASCLASARWLAALDGGKRSEMYRWLQAYVERGKKVSLGFTGATVADLVAFLPEAVYLVDQNPQVFELLVRPFSHDSALVRSRAGFAQNVSLGTAAIMESFKNVTPYFLPPEFMLTNEQVRQLSEMAVAGVFINASRFKPSIASRIPTTPYRLQGALGASLISIPLEGALTHAYLTSIHTWDATPWNTALADGTRMSWRDGESWLFLPDGIEREAAWLAGESPSIRRLFVREALGILSIEEAPAWSSYPVHSFSDWARELRMLGYLQRANIVEKKVASFTPEQLALWTQVINSDVLSAVEKDDPRITIRERSGAEQTLVLSRSERGYEGEDCLVILESLESSPVRAYLEESDRPHMRKLRARLARIAALRK